QAGLLACVVRDRPVRTQTQLTGTDQKARSFRNQHGVAVVGKRCWKGRWIDGNSHERHPASWLGILRSFAARRGLSSIAAGRSQQNATLAYAQNRVAEKGDRSMRGVLPA